MDSQPWILLTNDDGIDSPTLGPAATALSSLAPVRIVVPDRERSWIGKAMSRFEPITTTGHDIDGHQAIAVTGYPADCAQLGVRSLFDQPPALVVSGINIGANHGASYVSASGTVGAALEAAMVGVAAVAVSAVREGDWETWWPYMASAASRPDWERLAEVATDIVAEVWANGLPASADILLVNIPGAADITTPRRLTRLADSRHGTLFVERDGGYEHRGSAGLRPTEPDATDTDMATTEAGLVSITPLRLAEMGQHIDPELRVRFER